MAMGDDTVVRLARLGHRVDVDDHRRCMGHVMENLVPHFLGDPVTFGYGELTVHHDVELEREAMADPPPTHLGHVGHARRVARRVSDRLQDLWLDAVQHPSEDGPGRVPNQDEDGPSDQEPDQWIRQGVARPHARRPAQDREARQPVHPCVIAVRDECRTPNLAPYADPEDRVA